MSIREYSLTFSNLSSRLSDPACSHNG